MKIGIKIKVIDGGCGCRIADGITGVTCERKEAIDADNDNKYHGEWNTLKAPVYIKGEDEEYYGLCKGYEIELL